MKTLYFTMFLLAPIIINAGEASAEMKSMDELVTELRKVVPKTWKVELSKESGRNSSIMVRRLEKVKGLPDGVNFLPGDSDKLHEVVFVLHARGYIDQKEHDRRKKWNAESKQKRLDFERKSTVRVKAVHMGPPPIPPGHYKPETEEGRRWVKEYALLWQATEPKWLPNYYYKNLSFTARFGKIHTFGKNKKVEEEIDSVEKAVVGVLKQYKNPNEKDPADDR